MDLTTLTPTNLDDRVRVDAGVDLLGRRPPPTRMVLFSRGTATLYAEGRPRRAEEPLLDHLVELAYLCQAVRSRHMALCFAGRGVTAVDELVLHVATVRRPIGGGLRVEHREHGMVLGDEGLVGWRPVRHIPVPGMIEALARAAMRPPRRGRRAHHPALVADVLSREGHRVIVTAPLARKVGGSDQVTVLP